MKTLSQYILAVMLFAFIAMITDLAGLYVAIAVDDSSTVESIGCHNADMPSDWVHDEPCTPDGFQPCHICAIILEYLSGPFVDKIVSHHERFAQSLTGIITDCDPDPPKSYLH